MLIRDAALSDSDAIASIHAESWRGSYRGILSDEFLDGAVWDERRSFWQKRMQEQGAERRLVLVACKNVLPVAFLCLYLDADKKWGALLDNLHVLPEAKGQGLGTELMSKAAKFVFEQRPGSGLYLWVYEQNSRARGFYEKLLGNPAETLLKKTVDGSHVRAVRYVWTDVNVLMKAFKPFE